MRGSLLIACAAVALVASTSGASAKEVPSCAGANSAPAVVTVEQTRAALACLINQARDDRGATKLKVDTRLQRAAQRFARALKPTGTLTHKGSGGSTPLERIATSGYPRGSAFTAAEALGRSDSGLATPAVRVAHWLEDSATRKVLMSATYRDVGIGVVTRGPLTTFVVEVAKRMPQPKSGAAKKTT